MLSPLRGQNAPCCRRIYRGCQRRLQAKPASACSLAIASSSCQVTHLRALCGGRPGLVHAAALNRRRSCSPASRSAPSPGAAAPQRIIAVGDLHGDFQAWIDDRPGSAADRCRAATGPAARRPSSSSATSPTADRIRSRSSAACSSSRRKRRATGGRVVVVLGNHEAMNLLGDNRYTTPGEYAAFVDDRSVARRERLYMTQCASSSKPPPATIRR